MMIDKRINKESRGWVRGVGKGSGTEKSFI